MLGGQDRKGLARDATFEFVQPILAFAAAHLDDDVSLAALAAKASLSPFYLHRVFLAAARETPKQFTMRLRLAHAAAKLLMTDDSVLAVALSCGFQSHEVFIRAFRRSFGMAQARIAGAALPSESARRRPGNTPRSCSRLVRVSRFITSTNARRPR